MHAVHAVYVLDYGEEGDETVQLLAPQSPISTSQPPPAVTSTRVRPPAAP